MTNFCGILPITVDLPQKEEEKESQPQFLADGEEDDDDGGDNEDGGDDQLRSKWVNGDSRPDKTMRKLFEARP